MQKTLLTVMDSVMNLMKEVELQENGAEKSRVEAASGGLDTLEKVEELKKMLEHAKEANDMVILLLPIMCLDMLLNMP